jgi:hypothetical protein
MSNNTDRNLYDKSGAKLQGINAFQPPGSTTIADIAASENIGTRHSDTERKAAAAPAAIAQQGSQPPYKDCLPCKLTGAAAFSGIGIYALNEAKKLQKMPSRQGAAVGIGVTGVGEHTLFYVSNPILIILNLLY